MSEISPYERFPTMAPIFGSILAVSFDVGYFSAVGINYFTFFSLSEHIVFAVEALPFAIIVVVLGLSVQAFAHWMYQRFKAKLARATDQADLPVERLNVEIRLLKKHRRRLAVLFYSVMLLGMGWLAYQESYRLLVVLAVMFVTTVASDLAERTWYTSSGPALLLLATTSAFLFGNFIATEYLKDTNSRETLKLKSGEGLSIKVIRAGERGLLYVNPQQDAVAFIQWGEIQSISRSGGVAK